MSTYIIVRNDNYSSLSHHGVKGMKWGVRRAEKYEARANRWAKREEKFKTRFGKNFAGQQKIANRYQAEQSRAVAGEKTIKGKLRQKHGAEAIARTNEYAAQVHSMRAQRAKTERSRTKHQSRAYNAQSIAAHKTRIASSSKSSVKRYVKEMKTVWKVPLKTAKGKNTTVGKQAAKAMAISMAMSMIEGGVQGYLRG